MKIPTCFVSCIVALALTTAFAEPTNQPTPKAEAPPLTKFNLDFPGGTPSELVAAIQRATGKRLNVIIPDKFADVQLPPLKMNNVDALQLFLALGDTGCGFRSRGALTDNSVWTFFGRRPTEKECRFYPLADYLERGFTVDDITTAIQTGWKMLGDSTDTPSISFHKETKLLIAVGEPSKLEIIDSALVALELPRPRPVFVPMTGRPLGADKPRSND